jgi:hypothetical protein
MKTYKHQTKNNPNHSHNPHGSAGFDDAEVMEVLHVFQSSSAAGLVRLSNGDLAVEKGDPSGKTYAIEKNAEKIGRRFGVKMPRVARYERSVRSAFVEGKTLYELTDPEEGGDERRYETHGLAQAIWPQIRAIALTDAVAENYDRHPGNILIDNLGNVWAIDNDRADAPVGSAHPPSLIMPRQIIPHQFADFGSMPLSDSEINTLRDIARDVSFAKPDRLRAGFLADRKAIAIQNDSNRSALRDEWFAWKAKQKYV